MRILESRWFTPLFLLACFVALFFLWLPWADFPIVSDSALYALLGESLWTKGQYALFGESHGKHLPLHALAWYPLVPFFGYSLAYKIGTFLASCAGLVATYLLTRRGFHSTLIAVAVTLTLVFHHNFAFISTLASADPLFIALFLFSLYFYLRAGDDERWYIAMGACMGFACLTRYNGLPLFALYPVSVFLQRRAHLRSRWFWGGMCLGGLIFVPWVLRYLFVFGLAENDYTDLATKEHGGFLREFFTNLWYYGRPHGNILPILLLFSFYGLFRTGRQHLFLILAMLAAWIIALEWPIQDMRYTLAGYPILMGFGYIGIRDIWQRLPHFRIAFLSLCALGILVTHGLALCLYTYGSCNAWFDRTVGLIPADLHLTSEGFYGWELAQAYVNEHAEPHAFFEVRSAWAERVWGKGVFRPDIQIVENAGDQCPVYRIDGDVQEDGIVFDTGFVPRTMVIRKSC